ncbi:hypothetical protein BwSH20_76370 [Bradyrhizobium ottawaense]|nr:hypothetical protein BwSH12_77110 [Bradyrhizobium ottawaense]GMO10915.1 hypothetical protein BwSH20_76370 [Bradyrhizobium ottawaense]GMO39210.1 hypothetical protein BwSH14_49020 [Bradyrhizobium ottawaense]GMO52036.1 hypothetical protein BwSF21_75360 [Bradyrhizobium ottawaense]GMO87390.1 hypothetical protein BwSH17_71670 [Bradyrhizobium ottawaense]
MMMLGPPDRLLPRGTEAVTGNTKHVAYLTFLRLPSIPHACPEIHRSAEIEKDRRRSTKTAPADRTRAGAS